LLDGLVARHALISGYGRQSKLERQLKMIAVFLDKGI